jgi:hypothetical protein
MRTKLPSAKIASRTIKVHDCIVRAASLGQKLNASEKLTPTCTVQYLPTFEREELVGTLKGQA